MITGHFIQESAKRSKRILQFHALLMGKEVINEPFAIINADDFYGRESFQVLADFLVAVADKKNEYCMGKQVKVKGFRILPRTDKSNAGKVKDYRFFLQEKPFKVE